MTETPTTTCAFSRCLQNFAQTCLTSSLLLCPHTLFHATFLRCAEIIIHTLAAYFTLAALPRGRSFAAGALLAFAATGATGSLRGVTGPLVLRFRPSRK